MLDESTNTACSEAIEQRLATLEQEVANLKQKSAAEPASPNWLDKLTGSISDEAAFLEALEYGRQFRDADKPVDENSEPV